MFRAGLGKDLRQSIEAALKSAQASVQTEFSSQRTNLLVVDKELLAMGDLKLMKTQYAAQAKARQNRSQSPHPTGNRLRSRARMLLQAAKKPEARGKSSGGERASFSLGEFLKNNASRIVLAEDLLRSLEAW
jgi:hypothetical protein